MDHICMNERNKGVYISGNDPGTDLRGAGLFGLWLLIVGSERNDPKMFSESKKYNFPYCTTLLTLCRAVIRLLKENQLNSFINQW